jgi:enoyl-CoA hydratase/carnithine racemase
MGITIFDSSIGGLGAAHMHPVHLAMLQRRMFFTCWSKWEFIQVLIKKKFFLLLALSRRRSAGLYLVIAFKLAHKSKTFIQPSETVLEKALEIAKQIGRNGPIAVKQAKFAIEKGLDVDLNTGLAIEQNAYDYDSYKGSSGRTASIQRKTHSCL